jgi:hypothetical protein
MLSALRCSALKPTAASSCSGRRSRGLGSGIWPDLPCMQTRHYMVVASVSPVLGGLTWMFPNLPLAPAGQGLEYNVRGLRIASDKQWRGGLFVEYKNNKILKFISFTCLQYSTMLVVNCSSLKTYIPGLIHRPWVPLVSVSTYVGIKWAF